MAEDELIDFCDAQGNHLGRATRAEVHRRGLWHRTLDLWLATPDDGGSLLYQLRAESKLNWPGKLDATVAGHLLAGESHRTALRESREEIGIDVPPEAVIALGERREESSDVRGHVNRELQGVHIARYEPGWGTFGAVDDEAAGLLRIGHEDGLRLHRGMVESITCDALIFGSDPGHWARRTVTLEDFVPRPGYYLRMHDIAAALIRGEPATSLIETYARLS